MSGSSPTLPDPLPPASQRWLPVPQPLEQSWSRRKFQWMFLLVLGSQVLLVGLLGTKTRLQPRALTQVPHLQLVSPDSEWIGLGDPTLFARPNAHDVASAYWRQVPGRPLPQFAWPAPAGNLGSAAAELGGKFRDQLELQRPAEAPRPIKPEPLAAPPPVDWTAAPAQTTWQITGDLARRPLLGGATTPWPALAAAEVLGPSTVQVLVDQAGNLASAVIVHPNSNAAADQEAMKLVRNLRFAPGPNLTFGEITFYWHTLPATTSQ